MSNLQRHKDCTMRSEIGNCLAIGGFCTSVSKETCEALQNAYTKGRHSIEVSEDNAIRIIENECFRDDLSKEVKDYLFSDLRHKLYHEQAEVSEEELPKDIVEPIGNGNVVMSEDTYDELIKQSVVSDDAISRSDTIKALQGRAETIDSAYTACAVIRSMSSVVPTVPSEECVRIADVYNALDRYFKGNAESVYSLIDELPSVVPSEQVVGKLADEDIARVSELKDTMKDAVIKLDRPRGEWIEKGSHCRCSECGYLRFGASADYCNKSIHFCEKCGADMRGVE